jgi:hypothetical protein
MLLWESLFIVGRRYWIHHWFGVYLAITYSSRVWRRVVDAIHGEYFDNSRIGPIITALICAGRIGSGIGAELGSMRVTEQLTRWKFLALIRSNT